MRLVLSDGRLVLPDGLHDGISHDDYHADPSERPSLSSHLANVVVSHSAGHAKLIHPRFVGQRKPASDAMDTGSLLHAFLLGGGAGIVEVDADDWKTKDARQKREEARASGKIAVLKHKLATARAAASEIEKALPFSLETARKEVTALWTDQATNCPCRCRIDALMPDLWIWDLKIVDDATVSAASRNIANNGYHVQAAANIDAVETLIPESAGRVRFGLCFVEWETPSIGIMRREIRGQLLDVGQQRWNRAKSTWARCLAENKWPGYSTEIEEAQCLAWVANDEFKEQVAAQGPPAF